MVGRGIAVLLLGLACEIAPLTAMAGAVDYDIVYVRQARYGDTTNTIWPEVFHPGRLDPGADLVLLHPNGSEEILVDCTDCGVTDPIISFDGQYVYYSLFPDLTSLNSQRGNLPLQGADIFRMHLGTRQVEQLTFGEFTPNTGAGNWDESNPVNPAGTYNRLGYGILNLGPMPLPGERLAFTSNRNGYIPTQSFTNPTMQLFVMDIDGGNVEQIAPMNIGSALHPTILRDGRLMFSSYESQGLRDRRVWAIWSIYPDGRNWAPVVSSLTAPEAFHFMTQTSNQDIIVDAYYNLNNNGFGALFGLPVSPPPGTPPFYGAFPSQNPPIDETRSFGPTTFRFPFTPWGYYAVTPMTHKEDNAAPIGNDGVTRVGKFTHPSAAPNNDLLVVWTPGPANDLNRPTTDPRYDAGLYVIPNTTPVWDPSELVLIKNDPAYNEAWPRAVVPYSAVHGVDEPDDLPWLPNDGSVHSLLPAGTPYGLVGTSSFYKRESFPGRGDGSFDGLDPFNTSQNGASSNWSYQGSDAGLYDDSDIWAVRIVAMEGNTSRLYGPNATELDGGDFHSHANERLRILGEIPLRKSDGRGGAILDAEGNPDTSFLAKIPADTPFTFQTIDRNGMVLNIAQTWHQVRPGEMRADCGGCHAHSQMPLAFAGTEASKGGYNVYDLSKVTPLVTQDGAGQPQLVELPASMLDVEFYADIRPVLQAHCVSCHNGNQNAGNLNLNDLNLYGNLPGDYKRLADDSEANWGYPPVINNGIWRQTNASRYVRMFQSRRSLLIWKIFGARLDGWTNSDHPTESVPGDQGTLPGGANPNDADLDFVPSTDHPAGGMPALTIEQKMAFARWIDLGAPIDVAATRGNPGMGWFEDNLRPTLTISVPRPDYNPVPPARIRFGMVDAYTGLDLSTLSVQASFTVQGRVPRSELADLASPVGDGIWEINFGGPLPPNLFNAHVLAQVADNQGNIKRVDVQFSTAATGLVFADSFED
ncbi:MAG: hypothetical protein QNJ40_00170 [Xanthomonadales bacterium]|nr:hypothetical protein [Xanthomonadales bacterium]